MRNGLLTLNTLVRFSSLAMIVLPDHKTLAHVMQHEGIRARIFMEDKPAVCLLTREMLYSI